MMTPYFPATTFTNPQGVLLDYRAHLALDFLRSGGMAVGMLSADGSLKEPLPVPATILRAFAMAEMFVSEAESRGYLHKQLFEDCEVAYRLQGRLNRIHDSQRNPMIPEE